MTIGGARPRPAGLALQDPPLPQTRGAGRTIWEDRNMKKRLISWLLILALCVSVLPAAALAAEPEDTALTGTEQTVDPAEPARSVFTSGEETHKHYLCGGATCNKEGHDDEGDNKVTFEAWPGITKVGNGGPYYLTESVGSFTVPSGVNLTLCLNGCSITGGWDGPVITVEPGATLTLCNCKSSGYIGHSRDVHGAGVFVGEEDDSMEGTGQNNAAFYMYGGTIGSNSDGATKAGDYIYGSGVVVMGGTFYMYGGTITNNSVDAVGNKSYGGGVSVFNNGTFNMSGGEITGNKANYGGGVGVGRGVGINHAKNKTGGTFSMSGGEITGNVGKYAAGGVHAGCGSETIFTVSGSAQITDNYLGDPYTSSTANNVYLLEGNTEFEVEDAIINVGTLDSTAKIGVTTEKGEQIVATGVSTADAKRFFSDDSDRRLQYANGTLTMVASVHENHPECGDASCTDGAHALPTGGKWTGVSELRNSLSKGRYYLTKDVTIDSTWTPQYDVVLCLNGYSITMENDGDAITVGAGKTFTLCDCVGGGEITHAAGKSGAGVCVEGADEKKATFNMYGGTITGNTGHTVTVNGTDYVRGGGVYVGSYAQFFMRGGSVTGNTAAQGGGVYYNTASNSLFVSGNVNIMGNKDTDDNNNNVYVPSSSGTPKTVPFYIGQDGLAEEARIGVRVNDGVIGTGEHSPVAQFAPQTNMTSAYREGNFIPDNGSVYGFKMEAKEHDTITSTHVVNLYNGLPHVHYLCNGKDANGDNECTKGGGHKESKTVEFKPWTDATKLPEEAGSYYLTKDVVLEKTWDVPAVERFGCVNLCLNGHSITLSESSSDTNTIRVGETGTYTGLAICDCNGSEQGNGRITGASGSGVYVSSRATNTWFYLYGGKITGNGTGVHNLRDSVMYGGTITGNNVGVDYGTSRIATFRVSGDVQITGNQSTDGIANNVHLNNSQTLIVSGALSDTAKIGVTTASTIAEGGYATVAKGDDHDVRYTLTTDDLNHFESDAGYTPMLNGNTVIFANGKLHQHAACGKTSCADGHSNVIWTPLTYDAENKLCYGGKKATQKGSENLITYVLPAGNYYLSDNIEIDGFIQINDGVNLCLNGKTLSTTKENWSAQYFTFIVVSKGGTLTLCDCESGGTIRANNLDGGVQTNVGDTTTSGGKFIMYGGTITGVNYGVRAADEFVMYGGAIKAVKGGVYTTSSGNFRMYGGEISDNSDYGVRFMGTPVTVGGSAKITGNGYTENVTLNGTITIDPSLTQEARIGVRLPSNDLPDGSSKKLFATGATGSLDYANIFSCDNGSDYVLTKDTSGNLYFGKHQHVWSYTAEGATITATCTADGCNLPNKSGGSVTIAAPAADTLTYDGNGKPATLTDNFVTGITMPTISYSYKVNNNPATLSPGEAPINAREYTASITMGEEPNKVTASVNYTIAPARLVITARSTVIDYGSEPVNDGVDYQGFVNGETESVLIGELEFEHEYTQYGKVGDYDITPKGLTSRNYDITFLPGKLQVKPRPIIVTVNEVSREYGAANPELAYTASRLVAAEQAVVNGDDLGLTLSTTATAASPVDDYDVTCNTDYNSNYSITFDGTGKLKVTPKKITVTADNKSSRVGQPIVPLTYTYTPELIGSDEFNGELATNANKDTAGTYTIAQGTLTLGDNYNIDFVSGTYTVNAKNEQTNFNFAGVENGKVAKVYGADTEFTLAATGAATDSTVTYESTNTSVAEVDSTTGKVTIKGAGTTTIKATASATDDYAQGVATYELTVSPKTLTAADLEFTTGSTFTKTYDGDTACTTATVQIKATAKVNATDNLPEVQGTYAYDNANVKNASKVTFTSERTENTNYTLPANLTVENAASITKRVLTVGNVTTTPKKYDGYDNATLYVTGIALNGTVSGETLTFYTTETGGDYGITDTKFDNANAGQNKQITGTVALLSSVTNYSFANGATTAPFTATGTITPADGGSKGSVERTQRFTDENPKTETIAWTQLLPANQTWNYNSSFNTSTGTLAHVDHSVNNNTGALTYTITGGSVGDQFTFTVTAKCNNYDDFTYTVTVRLMARDPQTLVFEGVTDGKVAKTYGDQPFTEPLTGAETKVTYTSSKPSVATVNATTGEVTIVGAGETTITATAAETDVYASASVSYTLKVNKLRIAIPKPGKNELEYNGDEQTYTPAGLNTEYCTIINNKATDVLANNANYTATVSLKDTANTEWDEEPNGAPEKTYSFRITPAPLTVTALDKKITAGQPAPELTSADYTVSGLFDGDPLNVSLHYADPAAPNVPVRPDTSKAGTYAIIVGFGGTSNPNYDPTFVPGTLTIEAVQTSQKLGISAPGRTPGGSYELTPKNAQPGDTVTISVSPDKGYELGGLTVRDMDGNELDLKRERSGDYTFTMPKSSVSVSISFVREDDALFDDVFAGDYYYNAVQWAAEQGITGGVSRNLFAPDASCTRAQIVTFLWRAAGSPEPETMSAFKDVPAGAYYAKAVAWAVENGITKGLSADAFGPDAPCTRAQAVTFLARALDESADGAADFTDVSADAYYAKPVAWAVESAVTNGVSKTRFAPNETCTRAQIVTFLYRAYKRMK